MSGRPRFHVEGQTSTEGRRWQIWDGEQHYARFRNIANANDALGLCEALNEQGALQEQVRVLREAFGIADSIAFGAMDYGYYVGEGLVEKLAKARALSTYEATK